ncbi:MAG: glycosyltransferase family 39 protein [Burkholderiaceae bacterium]|nr:glycosyltransferase family 39 protein [Burkholderiaceae bacterium]
MNRRDARLDATWLLALLLLLAAAGLARPLLPIDETRYAAVAWEMWARGDALLPVLNGQPYHHKPPLLFWLIQAGWAVFGVQSWWLRLLPPLFAAGTLGLAVLLARELWPQRPEVARIAPFVLLASLLFGYFATALMFDMLLSFFVALGLLGLARAWRRGDAGGRPAGFVLLGLGLGGALFSKGPVGLLHLLPAALFAPLWMVEQRPPWRRWYAGVVAAVLGGAAMILAWAIPAGFAGGEAYRAAIFWGQTANRMVESFAHRAPGWFYLVALPWMLAPWLLWPRWWRGLRQGMLADSGLRLALGSALFCLVFFSFVSGKRWQYLLPEFTLFALVVARALAGRGDEAARPPGRWSLLLPALTLAGVGVVVLVAAPRLAARLDLAEDARALVLGGALALACGAALLLRRPAAALVDVRRVATAAVIAVAGLMVAVDVAMREPYDLAEVGDRLSQLEQAGRPLAIGDAYHGQWTLAGRLRRPLVTLPPDGVAPWLAAHPDGRALFVYRDASELPAAARVEYRRRYRGGWIAILAAPG